MPPAAMREAANANPTVQDKKQTEMTDLEFEERKTLLRRQAEQLRVLYADPNRSIKPSAIEQQPMNEAPL